MTITEIIEKSIEEFDDEFIVDKYVRFGGEYKAIDNKKGKVEEIKFHINNTLIAIAKSEIERLNNCKKTANELKQEMGIGYNDRSVKVAYKEGHNHSINKQMYYWQEVLGELIK